jgi:hypothetical protein
MYNEEESDPYQIGKLRDRARRGVETGGVLEGLYRHWRIKHIVHKHMDTLICSTVAVLDLHLSSPSFQNLSDILVHLTLAHYTTCKIEKLSHSGP